MKQMNLPFFVLGLMLLLATTTFGQTADPLGEYNIVWDSPSKNSSGSMPIGNGDIGLNVWAEENGDLLFYIGKTDAFSGIGRLLKLGRVRVTLSPSPFAEGLPFRQTLKLRQGRIEIVAGGEGEQVTLNVWVDANHPVVYVQAESRQEFDVHASLETWRTQSRTMTDQREHSSVRGMMGSPDPLVVEPDTIVDDAQDRVVWYHRNQASIWPIVLRHQGLESVIKPQNDPLLHRTFGGLIEGQGLIKQNRTTLKSSRKNNRHTLAVYVLTRRTAAPEKWLAALDETIVRTKQTDFDRARANHEAWWNDFWDRSWIRVTSSKEVLPAGFAAKQLVRNTLPLRIGADSNAQNRFAGDVDRALVYRRALSAEEIADHAAGNMPAPGKAAGSVADWNFDDLKDGLTSSAAEGHLPARVVGEVELVEGRRPSSKAVRLTGAGYLETPHSDLLDLEEAVTLEAWIRPKQTLGRIIDKTKAATADGYMLDTHPGNALRLVVEDGNLQGNAQLAVDRWAHVAGVFDAKTGRKELYVDGKRIEGNSPQSRSDDPRTRDPAYVVSRGYALQRWINACAGRGSLPIKFNGTIFTVDAPPYDADFRRWGGCYWFQNTRLPYWTMLAAGDFDLMQPFFKMYLDALPLCKDRVRIYYDHGGAFFPETMYFWGTPTNTDYRWNRGNDPDGFVQNAYIRYYWSGGLELTAMMLDHYAFTADRHFLQETLLPLASAIIEFYDQHYRRDDRGKVLFEPAASLETWHVAVNPLPEIAGLMFVLDGLLKLPADATTEQQRADWQRLLDELPPLPAGKQDDKTFLLPAKEFSRLANSENPELYAVFPYRLFGLGKPDLEVGRLTFQRRRVKRTGGWTQDPIQAALLGLTDIAQQYTTVNFSTWHTGSRFPAFWGPNFDWIPDQDHGSVAMTALQTMLLQTEDRKILLLPAWPEHWNVEFKLHAPLNTTIEGVYRDGKLERSKVTPEDRAKDVEVLVGDRQ